MLTFCVLMKRGPTEIGIKWTKVEGEQEDLPSSAQSLQFPAEAEASIQAKCWSFLWLKKFKPCSETKLNYEFALKRKTKAT